MKIKFTNLDILAEVKNCSKFLNSRLTNIYEINSKIIILKLTHDKEKIFIKLTSGFRFHTINDKPQECKQMPSTFTLKLRKHMNNKRLISITQLGMDRIVDFQFGENEYAYHIIFEIYSTGNIILTDNAYKIVTLQRRYVSDNLDISVGKQYPKEQFEQIDYTNLGPQFNKLFKNPEEDYKTLVNTEHYKGYITNGTTFSPFKPDNMTNTQEFDSFDDALRQFFINEERTEQVITKKGKKNKETTKYDRAKKDLDKRVKGMEKKMEKNESSGEWIYNNIDYVTELINTANSVSRRQITDYMKENGIKYNPKTHTMIIGKNVEIDCNISAYANGDKYFGNKKRINKKYQKSVIEGTKALDKLKKMDKKEAKQAEPKVFPYEEMTFWFQTYNWYMFDNKYLAICGKNADQNEEIVKKHMSKGDIYLHGDFYGSPSMIVKCLTNTFEEIPINILLRAGDFLVCMSPNWKVARAENSYYVNSDQVSKTAPTGEYINKGSFMIRGKKNYLPEARLELGVAPLFVTRTKKFVTNPDNNTEEIVGCVPITGPYRDMKSKYKYIAKLKPGKQKQGKILSGIYAKLKSNNERDNFLIKKIKKDDWCKIVKTHSHLV